MNPWRTERNALIDRWYGHVPKPTRNLSRTQQTPVSQADYLGIPAPINSRYHAFDYCLAWLGALSAKGYGHVEAAGEKQPAHHATYRMTGRQIPAGLQLNHLCNRPYCVQPAHLYPGTAQDNTDDRKVFNSHELVLVEHLPYMTPETLEGDDFLIRLAQPSRYQTPTPWDPPIRQGQDHLVEWTCPGHIYQIPAGDAKVCRVCVHSDMIDAVQGFHPSVTATDLLPALRGMEKALDRLISGTLSQPEHAEWLERLNHRTSGIGRGRQHDPIDCPCHLCVPDRRRLQTIIDENLTSHERSVANACVLLRPELARALDDARKAVIEHQALISDTWTQRQKYAYRHHLPACKNTALERTQHLTLLESNLATTFLAFLEHEDWPSLQDSETIVLLRILLPAGPTCITQTHIDRVSPLIRTALYRLHEAVRRQILAFHLTQTKELEERLTMVALEFCTRCLTSMASYDLTGVALNSQTWPHPHSGCAAITVPIEFEIPEPMTPGGGFTHMQLGHQQPRYQSGRII